MQYVWLMILIVAGAVQNAGAKQYNVKAKEPSTFFFTAVLTFSAMLFFLISALNDFTYLKELWGYSVGFAVCYLLTLGGQFLAIKWGSLSLTTLIASYSLVIPTFYGIFFLKESLNAMGIAGLILLFLSIFLINKKKEKAAFSLKWLLSLLALLIGNGTCATIQKVYQVNYGAANKNEFMTVALLMAGVMFVIASLVTKEKIRVQPGLCVAFGALAGASNGLANMLIMMLTGLIPNAILFPSVSAGGIVLGFLLAVIVYHERLSKQQLIGYLMGTVSVVLLNL